jgi:hypothetical protein
MRLLNVTVRDSRAETLAQHVPRLLVLRFRSLEDIQVQPLNSPRPSGSARMWASI